MTKTVSLGLASALVAFTFLGCATQGVVVQEDFAADIPRENVVDVDMVVYLERAYVRDMSELGAGAAVMILAVGPFSRNLITLYGTIQHQGKSVGSFSKRLVWGENTFAIRAVKTSEIKLRLGAGGTRSGAAHLGYAILGVKPRQTVTIRMLESGVEIK